MIESPSSAVPSERFAALSFRNARLDWSRPYLMGVLNLTPDSFSDGGRYQDPEAALAAAQEMVEAGADLLDLGGESTRPGAEQVSAEEEWRRVGPVVEKLSAWGQVPVSIDTTKAAVARRAVEAGAELVNDVSGGRFDDQMLNTLAELGAAFVCGHVRGRELREVHAAPSPSFEELCRELAEPLMAAPPALRARTIIDPCLGFGKDLSSNLALIRRSGELARRLGYPVLIGPSRKRFLGEITGLGVEERDAATVGACLAAAQAGAHILRVHAVGPTASALQVFRAALGGSS